MLSKRHERLAKRMPCAVHVGQRRYSGLVLNVSEGGLFIQTNADPRRGHKVSLELQAPDVSLRIPLAGVVAWRKVVPSQLRQVAGGGFGVSIREADERYYRALSRWMRIGRGGVLPGVPSQKEIEALEHPVWRVRVRVTGGNRSRSLSVEAPDSVQARETALRHVGAGWSVLEVDIL